MDEQAFERALVARCIVGDEAAAERLAEHLIPKAERIAHRLGVDAADTEDIALETTWTMLRQIRGGAFRGAASLNTWMFSILRNKAADWRRQRAHVPGAPLKERSTTDGAVGAVEAGVFRRQVLAMLSRQSREALCSYYLRGRAIEEVAADLGVSVGRARNILTDAKREFRRASAADGCEARSRVKTQRHGGGSRAIAPSASSTRLGVSSVVRG